MGQAAWKYLDVYTGFIEEFADKLRLGPMAANEILAAHMNKKADIDGEAGMQFSAGGGLFPLVETFAPAVQAKRSEAKKLLIGTCVQRKMRTARTTPF